MLSCVVLISGRGSNLAAMIAARDSGRLELDIRAVISNKADAPGLRFARAAGTPVFFVDPARHQERESYDRELQRIIAPLRPRLVVLAGFMRILSAWFVSRYPSGMINLHPSLLPKYTGLNTYQRALDAGDKVFGASIHFVTAELDAGTVIAQASLPVQADDTARTMAERLQPVEHRLLLATLELLDSHKVSQKNDKLVIDGKSYEKPLLLVDGHLPVA